MSKNVHQFCNFKIHTQFSICEGATKIDELANYCKANKIQSMFGTSIHSVKHLELVIIDLSALANSSIIDSSMHESSILFSEEHDIIKIARNVISFGYKFI